MKETKLSLIQNGIFKIDYFELEKKEKDQDLILTSPINVGVCSSDIPRAFLKKAYFYPIVIGHEFCVSILDDIRDEFQQGQRCAVFPLIPCFECESCKNKKYNMCKNYSYYGSRVDGGLQSKLRVKRWNLIPIPESIDDISASLLEPASVCMHASKKIRENTKVLIFGGGFLAQIISQLLLLKNCNIFCIDRNSFKEGYFSNEVFFTTKETKLEESSFDVVIECCGGESVLSKCIKYGKPEAEIIQMANPSKNTNLDASTISMLMRKEQKIIGTWNSDFRPDNKEKCDWHQTISLLEKGQISIKKLISHEIDLKNAIQLLKNIYHRRTEKGKISFFNKAIIKIDS